MAFSVAPFTSDSTSRALCSLGMGSFATSGTNFPTLRVSFTDITITFVKTSTLLVLWSRTSVYGGQIYWSVCVCSGDPVVAWCVASLLHFASLVSWLLPRLVQNPFVSIGIIPHLGYPLLACPVTFRLSSCHTCMSRLGETGP